MLELLQFIPYHSTLRDQIEDFDCGSETDYQKELSTWLRDESELALQRGTKIWLYVNQDTEIVGFSSLGETYWKYPTKKAKRIRVLIIPAVAIQRQFWGKPETEKREERYSSQIMNHLLEEAKKWPERPLALGLYVHPDNVAAITLYERFDFLPFHTYYKDSETQVKYLGYVRAL